MREQEKIQPEPSAETLKSHFYLNKINKILPQIPRKTLIWEWEKEPRRITKLPEPPTLGFFQQHV